jgi:hypothetical protein
MDNRSRPATEAYRNGYDALWPDRPRTALSLETKPDGSWRRLTRYDSSGKRAIWMRIVDRWVEIRGGRDGCDTYATWEIDYMIPAYVLRDLAAVIDAHLWAQGDHDE